MNDDCGGLLPTCYVGDHLLNTYFNVNNVTIHMDYVIKV
jgi:hypothetical protein